MNASELVSKYPVVADLQALREVVWENPHACPFEEARQRLPLTSADIDDAEARLFLKEDSRLAISGAGNCHPPTT